MDDDPPTVSRSPSPELPPVAKRPRPSSVTLEELCQQSQWTEAAERARTHPNEAMSCNVTGTSPLALACRNGAPVESIKAILDASPFEIRNLLPSRGTPLHEAILCESIGTDGIRVLIEKDESLPGQRATLLQDVDGHTPLHLLIRRRSQSHILTGDDENWAALLHLVVKSCPQAVGIPDRGEYEEPPLVMALKAHIYAGADYESDDFLRIEKRIHDMVQTMLKYYPEGASQVLTGSRGQYTAIHSAVFHGRCSDAIQLLLDTKRDSSAACLLANTQGELPLHFAAMRGESPRTIHLLANAAPTAVMKRDAAGLTPLHWMWIRFVSTLLMLEDKGDNTILEFEQQSGLCDYTAFWFMEKGDFFSDLNLIRRLDPPVDFLRMRHIPPDLYEDHSAEKWALRSVELLAHVRTRRLAQRQLQQHDDAEGDDVNANMLEWTRAEAVTSLFWTKVVSLLKSACRTAPHYQEGQKFFLAHTAFATSSCPPHVAEISCQLFPEELSQRDHQGKLPLHHAATRKWHAWDLRNEGGAESAACKLLRGESLHLLETALFCSPPQAAKVTDDSGRLVLHHIIDTFVQACSSRMMDNSVAKNMLNILWQLLQLNPESLEQRDGQTKLYPFLQATAAATEHGIPSSPNVYPIPSPDELSISITYLLLRENPSLVHLGLGA